MAARQLTVTPRHCIQHSRFTKQDGWRLWDLALSLCGNIAVTGGNENTKRTSIDVYSSVKNSDSRDKPKIVYSKEFEKYSDEEWIYQYRYVSFVSDEILVSCLGNKLEVSQVSKDEVLRSRRVNGNARCLSVREREIFIGFEKSNKITVYDMTNLNEIKSIILQGIQDDDFPHDMTAIADKILVCVGHYSEESNDTFLIYDEKNKNILSELTKPTDTRWYTRSVTVCLKLGVVAVVWYDSYWLKDRPGHQIVFYSLFSQNNSSFLTVEIESGVLRISISDRGDRMVTMNRVTGEVKVYDMAELFTFHHLKENLTLQLQRDDCVMLTNYFGLPKDQSDVILKSEARTENLLLALEERGVINPSTVDRLIKAFHELKIRSCSQLVDFYKNTRMQVTSYDRFLATLSAHLTASLPGDLCGYFNISDETKSSITSSQSPGLSLLLALDEMKVIKPSDVRALEKPFTEMQLVQAVAMIREYQSLAEEKKSQLKRETEMTGDRKREYFLECLQRKIKSWYETMTPVPWRKSCQWKSADLFVGSGLILTDSRNKRSFSNIDEKCKVDYTKIFSHENLESQTRINLEGDPGSGKTMLLSQLAYDWSQGKLSKIKMLILLPLKLVQQKTIVEAIKDFYVPENEILSVGDIENFLQDDERPTHLLLDGLEEYSGRLTQQKSEVGQIMSNVKYPSCKVLLSSRSDFAEDLPKGPMLKLGRFGEKERSSYIERLFPEDSKRQVEIKQVIDDSPIIQDLCSVPLLFVLAVHNVENIQQAKKGPLDKVTPFVEGMVDTLCPLTSLIAKTQELNLGDQIQLERSLEELAYNGLCRGRQQLYWHKEFVDEKVENIKEWIDSGVLVVEEVSSAMSIQKQDQYLESESSRSVPEAAGGQSSVDVHSQVTRDSKDSDKGSKSAPQSHDDENQTQTMESSAKRVPLQVRFLHKIVQEWFAAKYFVSVISKISLDFLEKYLYEQLPLISPADLHHVLRFTCALYPPCCYVIIKHLLSYRTEEGDVPEYVMNCIFLCLAEYTGDYDSNILEVMTEVCMENIKIHSEDSRLLQQAKVAMLEVTSSRGILIRKLLLTDLVVSAKEDVLQFNSGVMLIALDTVDIIEISRWDQTLQEEDYSNILKFISKCKLSRKASLNFPDPPPRVDKVTANSLQEDDKTVTWIIGPKLGHVLDPTTGKWMLLKEVSSPKTQQNIRDAGANPCQQQYTGLQAEATISREGGNLEIPNAGVKLSVPPNAFEDDVDQHLIQMRIILPGAFDEPATSFTSNTSTVVELLPNNLRLKETAILTIPHCLELETDRGDGSYTAKIFISHHENGTLPVWEEQPNLLYYLDDTKCMVWLESFCWVKVQVNGATVKGKRIQVYTAGKELVHGDDIVELEVGYYPDLPAGGEILRNNKSLILLLRKPFIFLKKGKKPLTLTLQKIVPRSWKPTDLSQEIPFQCIADSEERSCPFVFENENKGPSLPVFIFWISQGDRGFRLTMRPQLKGINV